MTSTMKNKVIPTLFLLLSLTLLSVPLTLAQSVTYGVAKGDVFQYTYQVTWNSTDPSLPVPSDIAELNQTQSFQITITDVSGTTVNAQVTVQYRNGSSSTKEGFVDVSSGSIRLPYGYLIVPANLNVNDKVYSSGSMIINATSTRTYPSGERQINERIEENTAQNHNDKTDIFYDKIKGIGVSSFYESTDTYGSETEVYTESIVNTNSDQWAVVPEFPMLIIPLLFIAASTLALVAIKKSTSPLFTQSNGQ
jgi:hypothetical protein